MGSATENVTMQEQPTCCTQAVCSLDGEFMQDALLFPEADKSR